MVLRCGSARRNCRPGTCADQSLLRQRRPGVDRPPAIQLTHAIEICAGHYNRLTAAGASDDHGERSNQAAAGQSGFHAREGIGGKGSAVAADEDDVCAVIAELPLQLGLNVDKQSQHRSGDGRGHDRISLGLAPLAGDAGLWQRVVRFAARPLFDFHGLHRFKSRLRPTEWRNVWLVAPPGGSRAMALFDSLAAFAKGHIARFAVRSILLHPQGLLWSLSMGVGAWALVLAGLLLSHRADVAGCSDLELAARLLFRAFEAAAFLLVARRPSSAKILLLLIAAAADGLLATLPALVLAVAPAEAAFRVPRVGVSAATIFVLLVAMREWQLQGAKTPLRVRKVG